MKIFIFLLTLEMGIMPGGSLKYYDFHKTVKEIPFYGDFNFKGILFEKLYLSLGAKTILWKTEDGIDFKPDNILFTFSAGVEWKYLTIGFRHLCQHPIKTWDIAGNDTLIENWYEEVFIKFTLTNEGE